MVAHSGAWDGVLRVLRDPIFALVFAAFLALLGSTHIRRLARTALWLASVVILIWLAAHNASSAHVEIAVVTGITRVLLIFIGVLFLVAVIAMAVVLIVSRKSGPVSVPSPGEGPALRRRASLYAAGGDDADDRLILEEAGRFSDHLDRMSDLLDGLVSGVDGDHPVRACAIALRIYFSGLSGRSAAIGKIHDECNTDIARIADGPAGKSSTILLPLKEMANKNWFPTSGEWAIITELIDLRLPYPALRVICLKADWRAVAMVMCKSAACLALLAQAGGL